MLVGESAAGLEVAGGQALEVEAGEQPALGPGTPLPPTDNLGAESLHPIRKIADPGLADLHRPHAHPDGPGGEVAVAIAAEVAAALVAGSTQELVDLGAESGMEHPPSAFRTSCSIRSSGAGTGAVGGRTWYRADTAGPQ
jgi:hypothetical protein